ncbi:MAG TPA: TolC family protein [Chromatiales bacterium]|nr:TolC family protein [Chromatiales bacterium]
MHPCARRLRAWRALALGALLGIGQAAAASDPGVLEEEAAVRAALAASAALEAARQRAAAMAAVPPQAGTLPDPVLRLNAMNIPVDTFDLDQEAMTQLQVGFVQPVPFPGKLALRRAAAEHEAEAAAVSVEEVRLRLARDVRLAWWRLHHLDRALEVVERNQTLMRQLVEVAQAAYRVGKGLQQDVLLAELELSRLRDLELRLRKRRRSVEARLNALLNRPADTPVRLPRREPGTLPAAPAEEALYGIADARRPLLRALAARVRAAERRRELARRDLLPDFTVGATYGLRLDAPGGRERPDFLSVMVGVKLPLYADTKQRRAIDQRNAELMRMRSLLEDARQRVHAEIGQALAAYREALGQLELLERGILPQARQTVAAMLAAYQVGKVDFLNVVRAQITLYNHELRRWEMQSAAHQALARLAAATGKEIQR